TLILAPLRGLTDSTYRNVFSRFFPGFDSAVAPFITTYQGKAIKSSRLKDILPENNENLSITPQILAKNPENFQKIATILADLGYETVNWNLGCPYPMVANKMRGSGLLPHPEKIAYFLDAIQKAPLALSIKTRIGRTHPEEIMKLMPIFNQFPLTELIIHPRTGIQMYKGDVDLETFHACLDLSRHPVVYNGDINSIGDYNRLSEKFPTVSRWMIGRGALANPFLPGQIKAELSSLSAQTKLMPLRYKQLSIDKNHRQTLALFHDTLFQCYQENLSGPGHILGRMKGVWFYLSHSFVDGKKLLKKIQKTTRISQYRNIVQSAFEHKELLEEVTSH
ncbi:MAG: tRNA-dihydrouridine synthase family protein, partial [Desulfovibrionaceae bacterium]|nr:tRNA-dihydrouridine synthase family protein [Desulfovibrionaceae bacterium]